MSQLHAQSGDGDDNCPLCLQLNTIAGTTVQVYVPVSIYHTWEMLEEYLVEHLPAVSHLDTFGCELTLLDADTHQALQDPIQEDLWWRWNTQFSLIVHECLQQFERKEQIRGIEYEDYPKAIRVPANDTGILDAKAFVSLARLRRVKVDPGFHTIDRQAWRYCHSLRIVKLPDTVVAIGYAAFQGCYSLATVEMPGCVELGVRLFAECCALEQVGAITDGACHLAIGAVIGPYAFEECARLSQLSLPHVRAMMDGVAPSTPQTGIPQGCFHSSGIQQVALGRVLHWPPRLLTRDVLSLVFGYSPNVVRWRVGNIVDGGSHLAIGAIISQYAFEECAELAHLSLPHVRAVVDSGALTSPQAGLPQGCFFASGIQQVELGDDTYHIGHRALENCKALTRVHLANTGIHTLHMHTFAQCHSLVTIRLPNCLREIRAEVFVGCKALEMLTLRGSIRYLDTGPLGTAQSSSPLSMHGASRKHGEIRMPTMPLKAVSNSPPLSGSTASRLRTEIGLPLVADTVE